MDFDDLMTRYFATTDPDAITPALMDGGLERMRVDFGMERDAGRRFGLWALMHMLGGAPDIDIAFKDAGERDAARNFMDMVDRASG